MFKLLSGLLFQVFLLFNPLFTSALNKSDPSVSLLQNSISNNFSKKYCRSIQNGLSKDEAMTSAIIKTENIDEKRWPARLLAGVIDRWKNKALSPENIPESELVSYNSRGQEFYSLYQNRLKVLNAVDFGDLLLHMVTIFKEHSEILITYQNRFKYILVDDWHTGISFGEFNICRERSNENQ